MKNIEEIIAMGLSTIISGTLGGGIIYGIANRVISGNTNDDPSAYIVSGLIGAGLLALSAKTGKHVYNLIRRGEK